MAEEAVEEVAVAEEEAEVDQDMGKAKAMKIDSSTPQETQMRSRKNSIETTSSHLDAPSGTKRTAKSEMLKKTKVQGKLLTSAKKQFKKCSIYS